jgi:hypothetical protein
MIGFIGTSLQLESIITAHTFNSFWTAFVLRISDYCLSAVWILDCFLLLEFRVQSYFTTGGYITVFHECVVSETKYYFGATLWFFETYPLPRYVL